jgi:hypothetical protein
LCGANNPKNTAVIPINVTTMTNTTNKPSCAANSRSNARSKKYRVRALILRKNCIRNCRPMLLVCPHVYACLLFIPWYAVVCSSGPLTLLDTVFPARRGLSQCCASSRIHLISHLVGNSAFPQVHGRASRARHGTWRLFRTPVGRYRPVPASRCWSGLLQSKQ